jgi:NADPH:quinone reductase-like Zn-dependent oxidoreductase
MKDNFRKMKAVILPRHGGREVLQFVDDFPVPSPGAGEALIKIEAAGINNVDIVNRIGYPGITITLPHILGADMAGTVVELGESATGPKVGTRVVVYPLLSCGNCDLCREGRTNICLNWKFMGMHIKGGYAEYISVPAENLLPIAISAEEAVTLPVAGLTAYHGLKTVGGLRPGQIFFIWGGAGGLGSIAIQIAKYLGATVIATASSERKLGFMKNLGADLVLDRTKDDIPAAVKKFAPMGVDLVLDYVGPQTFQASFDMLKKGGTMMLCGIISGRETSFSIHMTYLRHLSIKGLYMGTKVEMWELLQLVESGKIKPYTGATLPLEDAAEGHRLMESRESMGKIALRVG